MNPVVRLSIAASLSCLLLSGCRINSEKNGKNDNVDISTPFGSMKVKTNENVDLSSIGITQYPGSVPVHDDSEKDKDNSSSADINLSFGDFHLGVKAASFQSSDSKSKIIEFYRKDLAKYGEVIECQDDQPIGTPTHTSQGLTCKDSGNKGDHVKISGIHTGEHGQIELKTGSETRQHIVAVESKNGGTHIGLVNLVLPVQIHSHDKNDSE